MDERLTEIIRAIRASASDACRWHIKTDELLKLTGLPQPEFYRTLYSLERKIHFGEALAGFSNGTVGELVTFLEALFGTAVEPAFTDAGLFLPYEARMELTESFTAAVASAQRAHSVEYGTFWSMVNVFRTFQKAFEVYIGEYFSIDGLIAATAENFRAVRAGDAFMKYAAEEYIRILFSRHILVFTELFSRIRAELVRSAFERGFFTSREKTEYYGAGTGGDGTDGTESDRSREAMRLFGFTSKTVTVKELKDRYRALIRKYHPDVNPAGLEMSKKLNAAYAFLASDCR